MIYKIEIKKANDNSYIIEAFSKEKGEDYKIGKLFYTAKNEKELIDNIKKISMELSPQTEDAEYISAFKEVTAMEG